MPPMEPMLESIAGREDDLVDLTRELIRFPTVNPPGEAYAPCAEFIGNRLAKSGFEIETFDLNFRPSFSWEKIL